MNGPLAKNPDKYVSYQQAQQQTEDIDPPDYADVCEQDVTDDVEKEVFDKADEDEDDNDEDSEKIIHLWNKDRVKLLWSKP